MNANISPKAQHDAEAKRILARRGVVIVEDEDGEIDEVVTGVDDDTPDDTATVVTADDYEGMSVKELRLECDAEGIEYKKKDTIAKLIEKLVAE